ncbi:hypothetical protein RD792_011570 [Penstemon davidsonii]|uniref:chalcone synthase n=1 Tax=Penstemon davidsonii TaxID=160366 RepID=A0ABR0D0F8_9LAMI|nr:hypothetical protein RD792_011570 [Penstemon davidsonii]
MMTVEEIRRAQRTEGPATVLAIGTATPTNCVDQSTYPDYYFRITNSEHMTELKLKFQRMCEKSMIKKRYMHLTEEILKENPNMCEYMAPSLDARQDIVVVEVPKLGKEAAQKAINEWGQPKSKITHLIFCTTSGVDMPGADYQLTKLLGLHPSVKRFMMYQQGCYGGGTVLRMAKDLAENNVGARVLVVFAINLTPNASMCKWLDMMCNECGRANVSLLTAEAALRLTLSGGAKLQAAMSCWLLRIDD